MENAAALLSEGELGVLEAAVAQGVKLQPGGDKAVAVAMIVKKAR